MWFGQGSMGGYTPVPVPEKTKSQKPRSKHRGSAPDLERPRRKLPGQQGQALEPSAQDLLDESANAC